MTVLKILKRDCAAAIPTDQRAFDKLEKSSKTVLGATQYQIKRQKLLHDCLVKQRRGRCSGLIPGYKRRGWRSVPARNNVVKKMEKTASAIVSPRLMTILTLAGISGNSFSDQHGASLFLAYASTQKNAIVTKKNAYIMPSNAALIKLVIMDITVAKTLWSPISPNMILNMARAGQKHTQCDSYNL